MNYGPLLFLAAFFALSSSWFAFVLVPKAQLGRLQQTNTLGAPVTYPVARPGLAQQGLQVYRANGCAYCHTQMVGQERTDIEVVVSELGTNQAALLEAVRKLKGVDSEEQAGRMLADISKPILRGVTRGEAALAVGALNGAGAKASLQIVPIGADLARGWGKRRTVAEDFLFDSPVMPGMERIGPDLANVGIRQPDPNWHLRHLYAPRAEVKGSTMPRYPYLFERRRVGRAPSADALVLPADAAPEPGYEVVPTPEARALAAYLLSLRADAPLFSTPMTVAGGPAAAADTNAAPAGTASTTNTPAQ
jgi:cytochrome c oxidase cbb3-type subunit 2